MISYAQNYEDVILNRVFKGKKDGFYVDIGAAEPIVDSVTYHFYCLGWRGINVEPSPVFDELAKNRPYDINLNKAISSNKGEIDFFYFKNTGLSSIRKENLEYYNIEDISKTNSFLDSINSEVIKLVVEAVRLEDVFDQYCDGKEIDFLKVDVEGAEELVLESNNWSKFRPKVLVIEATLPMSKMLNYKDWEYILDNADYTFAYFDGLNRFYVRNDLTELMEDFSYPPCVFDDFIKYSEHRLLLELSAIHRTLIWRSASFLKRFYFKAKNAFKK